MASKTGPLLSKGARTHEVVLITHGDRLEKLLDSPEPTITSGTTSIIGDEIKGLWNYKKEGKATVYAVLQYKGEDDKLCDVTQINMAFIRKIYEKAGKALPEYIQDSIKRGKSQSHQDTSRSVSTIRASTNDVGTVSMSMFDHGEPTHDPATSSYETWVDELTRPDSPATGQES